MQRFLFLLGLMIGPGLAVAQAESVLADGQQKAAAGDIKGALQIYEELARRHPDSFEAHARLGGMQLLDRRDNDAITRFQQAVTLGDDSTRPFIGMGMAYLHLGRLGPARASLVEAKSRLVGDTQDIDDVIHWIDARGQAATKPIHP